MKKIICFAFVICLVVACFASCGSIKQNQAQKLIDQGDYQAAYEMLSEMKNNKKAQALLQNFQYVLVKRESGYLISSNPAYEEVFTYNEHGLLCKSVSEDTVFDYEYDQNKRLVKALYNGSLNNEYEYDDKGNLIKHTSWLGKYPQFGYEYAYDDQGRMIREVVLRGNPDFNILELSYTTEYTYDKDGNRTSRTWTYQNGSTTRTDYTYDKDGNLIREKTGEIIVVEYVYDKRGKLLEENYQDATVQYTYDKDGNLIKKQRDEQVNTTSEYVNEYFYDENGRLIKETYQGYGNSVSQEVKATTLYSYDQDGNLIKKDESRITGANLYVTNFTYDSNGNLIEFIESSVGSQTYVYKMEYQLVYVPYPIHESILGIIHPER